MKNDTFDNFSLFIFLYSFGQISPNKENEKFHPACILMIERKIVVFFLHKQKFGA